MIDERIEIEDIQATEKCIICGTYTTFITEKGECEECKPYSMEDKLKEEANNNDI